ncbi:hypothetical protein [Caulobacter hibisci]|uniref:Uncharacterized protein n=1 Tax=Caulobacter hibisci TaxID=2035993 RepID=A0ABS0T4J9_9CAUL|nr:hypothetical protein [Caulobacter hibisci]MBI1686810.1 hypothetical protein [Caulobacter hibisci]
MGVRNWEWWRDVVVVAFAVNIAATAAWIAATSAWPVVRRTFSSNAQSLAGRWRDFRINRMAWRLNRLQLIRRSPAVAIADILMATLIVILGGGYAMMILLAAVFIRLTQPSAHPELFSFVGGLGLVIAGLYRASDAYADLVQTDRRLAALRRKAAARGWDLEDASAALL